MTDPLPQGAPRPETPLRDGLWRAVYRAAFAGLRAYWFVARPEATGAHVALWHDDRLLLIRNSYRGKLSVPGGGVGRLEPPREAAGRELAEEVGIHLALDLLTPFGRVDVTHDHLRDRCHFFEARLEAPPTIHVDRREIVWGDFVDPRDLDPRDLHAPTRAYLGFRGLLPRVEGAEVQNAETDPQTGGSPG